MIREVQNDEPSQQALKSIINNRPVFLFAQGPTVQKFSEYKEFFKNKDIFITEMFYVFDTRIDFHLRKG